MFRLKHILCGMLAASVLATGWPAAAQPYKRGQPQQERRMQPAPRPVDDRREVRDQRHRGRFDRMSPEERRQLREDIGYHGREIYRDRRNGNRR